jgi:Ala-tRNA(Pro) deacylase
MDIQSYPLQQSLFSIFSRLDLDFQIVEHAPVYTIEEAASAVPHIDGIKTKNIFLRDAKGTRHILVIVPHDRRVDLLEFSRKLPSTKLSMGSPERLQRHLGVTAGAVSLFALSNDSGAAVELVVDEVVWAAERVQGHPLRNTATVSMSHTSLEAFLSHTGHRPRVMRVP